MQDVLWSIVTSKIFWANYILSIACLEYAIHKMKPMKVTSQAHKDRDETYKEFTRDDLDFVFNPMSRPLMYLLIPFGLPRGIICVLGWVYMGIVVWFVGLFIKKGKPYGPIPFFIVRWTIAFVCRLNLLMFGCWYLDYRKVYFDYSKYLGPDWKKEKATFG